MLRKVGGCSAVALAACALFIPAGQAQAQCCSQSNRSPQTNMLQGYLQQGYAMQQMATQQRYVQQAAVQQLFLQQAMQRQQFENQAVLKNGPKPPAVAKDAAMTRVDKLPDLSIDFSEAEPADPEQLAVSALKFVKALVADPNRRVSARIQLRQLINKYPNTAAAGQAEEMLARLK